MAGTVDRRSVLKILGAGVGGLVIGAAVSSLAVPRGQERLVATVTETRTVAETRTVTPTAVPQQAGVVVWGQGPEAESHYRFDNIVTAAGRVSKISGLVGQRVDLKVSGEYSTAQWPDYRTRLQNALSSGAAPEIFMESHYAVAPLSEAGWILDLDDLVKQYWDWGYNDFIEGLWASVRYKGRVWAIPQDTEARPVYYRKDLLQKLGWSDGEIEELPNRILKGDFTFQDMLETAAEAVRRGVVQPGYGIWHRPSAGPDWPIPYLAFGGSLYDEQRNVLVADMRVWYSVFDWFYQASMRQRKVIWDKLIGLDFNRDVHPTVVAGKVLFWFGGTWQKGQWVGSFGLKEEDFWRLFGFALYPPGSRGGRPVTLSQPLAYFIYSKTRNPELAFLLITMASDDYLNSLHAVASAHLAIRYSQLSHPEYARDRFLQQTGYMVKYASYQPNHPKWGTYSQLIFETIRGIEGGALDPDQAVKSLESSLRRQLGDSVAIRS